MERATAMNVYNRMDVLTSDPLRLVIMMYEGAIRALEDYKECFHKRDYVAKCRALNKAQEIISELQASLNMEAGEISRLLSGIYSYMGRRLVNGDLQRSLEPAEEVIRMLCELKEGWEAIEVKVQRAGGKADGQLEAFPLRRPLAAGI